MMGGDATNIQEFVATEAFYTPQEDDPTDGMGTPPLPDGQGIPSFSPLTAGTALPPDKQGTPPPPINTLATQVMEKQRPDELTLPRRQDQKVGQKVRKGLLKGNSASCISTPTRGERKVQFTLPSREEWHETVSHAPSRSSGPTPPIVPVIAKQPSTRGSRYVIHIYEYQNRAKVTATYSGMKLTRRQGGWGSQALRSAVDAPLTSPP